MTLIMTTDTKPLPPKLGVDLTLRDLSWFSQRVERGRKEIFSEIVTITPDIAKRLLEQNKDNRPINTKLISAIAKDIKSGHWQLNGESIIVTCDGELNDGQNRLLAIIEAGIPVQSLIAFGVTRASRNTVDMGKARTVGQFLSMNKIPSGNKLAAIARLHLVFLGGKVSFSGKEITKQDVLAIFEQEKDDFFIAWKEIGVSNFSVSVGGYSWLTVAYFNIHKIDSVNCVDFFEQLKSGANLEPHDPILWLRQKLMELINTKQNLRAENKLEIVLRYWNAWATRTEMKGHLKMNGTYPSIKIATRGKKGYIKKG